MNTHQLKSLIKSIIREVVESTEPSIGGSYSDQQTGIDGSNVRPEHDPLNDPELKVEEGEVSDEVVKLLQQIADNSDSEVELLRYIASGEKTLRKSPEDQHIQKTRAAIAKAMGKNLEEALKFKDFNWLSNMAGFGIPSDVYLDSTYIGTIESTPNGDHYKIVVVDTPQGKKRVSQEAKNNNFKSKNLAAETLRRTWAMIRKEGMFTA